MVQVFCFKTTSRRQHKEEYILIHFLLYFTFNQYLKKKTSNWTLLPDKNYYLYKTLTNINSFKKKNTFQIIDNLVSINYHLKNNLMVSFHRKQFYVSLLHKNPFF